MLRADAQAPHRDMESVVMETLSKRYGIAAEEIGTEETLADRVATALEPLWAMQKGRPGTSRLSEVEAACDPFPGQ